MHGVRDLRLFIQSHQMGLILIEDYALEFASSVKIYYPKSNASFLFFIYLKSLKDNLVHDTS